MNKFLSIVFLSVLSYSTYAQQDCGVPGNYCMSTTTVSTCSGSLFDSGGGGPYTDNTNYTMTICPDIPGDVIQLDLSAFALQTSPNANNSDYFTIFDGPTTAAAQLGSYTGNTLQGLQVTGTVNNPSGCLTIVFSDNGNANTASPGFEAAISCTTPCAPPTQNSVIANPAPTGPEQTVAICIGDEIDFSGVGSFAEPGFTLSQYFWNFDDGTIDTLSGQLTSHTFNEPGEYVVTLTVEDNNGCQSLNTTPLQILVSTIPTFPELNNITESTCFGEQVILQGASQSTQWTALPPQVVAGETYLADGAGFSYSTSLNFDFFDPGATLSTCADLYSILVNMEHSYMGDLGVSISCPNGTSVDLVTWGTNGGGGTFLGEAIDDGSTTPGIGSDYYWAPTSTAGTWGQASAGGLTTPTGGPTPGNSLTPGTYSAAGNLCDLVGCPLNGAWTFTVTDNLAIDNGYIFYWGINFNPALFPGVTTFTPSIGIDSDSSYWTGPNIIVIDADADIATIDPPGAGTYDYTYHVVNNFGCSFDSTIQITFTEPLTITAGPDLVYSCGDLTLQGGFQGIPTPSCAQDGGVFNYCYNNSDNFTWTFCPDVQNDGVSFMTFDFIAGQMENFFENFDVFDGPDATYPQIGNWSTGDATGQSWTATNPTGCITVTFTADGSVSCGSGSYQPWTYDVNCTNGGPQYTWEWTPSANLNNAGIPQPTMSSLAQETIYTLVGYPVGHPDCASTDQATVSINPVGDPGIDNSINICSTDPSFDMLTQIGGTPVTTGVWTNPSNAVVPLGIFDPLTMPSGNYTYTVTLGTCSLFSTLNIAFAGPTTMTIANDTAICYMGDLNLDQLTQAAGQAPFTYEWTYNGTVVANTPDAAINPTVSGQACLTVVDDCGYTITQCFDVDVAPDVTVTFTSPDPSKCWPETLTLVNTTDPTLYQNMAWEISNGDYVLNQDQLDLNFAAPGSYDVTLSVVTSIGCAYSTTISNYLTSFDPPQAGYTADPQPTDANNTVINFTDMSLGNISTYDWIFNIGAPLGTSSAQNPTFTFPQGTGGEYPVRLTVTDVNGCTDFIEGEIIIRNIFQYYIPNTFTPNNDGLNDVVSMVGSDIDENLFKLEIFNRWGDIVFNSTDPETVWTGNTYNGEYYCPEGVYNWTAVVVSKSTGERYEIQGHLNLIR
jgi:gliding motility-associated-like protein